MCNGEQAFIIQQLLIVLFIHQAERPLRTSVTLGRRARGTTNTSMGERSTVYQRPGWNTLEE